MAAILSRPQCVKKLMTYWWFEMPWCSGNITVMSHKWLGVNTHAVGDHNIFHVTYNITWYCISLATYIMVYDWHRQRAAREHTQSRRGESHTVWHPYNMVHFLTENSDYTTNSSPVRYRVSFVSSKPDLCSTLHYFIQYHVMLDCVINATNMS